MRADLYHWSVLRCGIPVTERSYGSTRPNDGTVCQPPNTGIVAYQATLQHALRSD
jgi:hypothetical protein